MIKIQNEDHQYGLDMVVGNFNLSDENTAIPFFVRTNIYTYRKYMKYLNETIKPNKYITIELDKTGIESLLQKQGINYNDKDILVEVIGLEGRDDPHSFCKKLIHGIRGKIIFGIYLNPKGEYGTQVPTFFSNHAVAFIDDNPKSQQI